MVTAIRKNIFDQLDSFAPIWSWGKKNDFYQWIIKIKKIGIKNILPKSQLYYAIQKYRMRYRKNLLNEKTIKLLESIPGWEWSCNSKGTVCSSKTLETIRKIKKIGIKNIYNSTKHHRNLFRTIQKYRMRYRKNLLNEKTIKLLESIPGWEWILHESVFVLGYSKMVRSVEKIKKIGIENISRDNNKSLYYKIYSYKYKYKKNTLNKMFIPLLESIPGWSWK